MVLLLSWYVIPGKPASRARALLHRFYAGLAADFASEGLTNCLRCGLMVTASMGATMRNTRESRSGSDRKRRKPLPLQGLAFLAEEPARMLRFLTAYRT